MNASHGLVVVTGASSGIGLAFARHYAALGHPLLLIARREDRLRAITHELVADHRVEVGFAVADLATEEGMRTAREAVDAVRALEVLVLNAGFGAFGRVAEIPRGRQTEMVRLNCEAVVDLACHALPRLVGQDRGDIVIVSSAAAWQPIPFTATYAATKAFELFFAEALAGELRGTGVRVVAACPGPTASEFGQVAGTGQSPRWMPVETPEGVVRATMTALERGRPRVATGGLAKLSTAAASLLPRRPVVWAAGAIHRLIGRNTRG